jgi:hypothetical protein
MDQDGKVSVLLVTYHGGEGLTFDEFHRRTLFWTVATAPAVVDGQRLCDDLQPGGVLHGFLERIHAGHTVAWDGSDMKGSVDAAGLAANEGLRRHLEDGTAYLDPTKSAWGAAEWLVGCDTSAGTLRNIGIEPGQQVEDDRISTLASDLLHEARTDGVLIMGGQEALAKVVRELVAFERGSRPHIAA